MSHIGTASRPLDQGLVLDLRFSEGVGAKTLDVSGYRNHGIIYGNPAWVDGKYGKGLNLDGDGDYISCGADPSIDLTGDYTISMWIKTTTIVALKTLYRKQYASYGAKLTYFNFPSIGKVLFFSGSGSNPNALASIISNLNNGTWRHLVFQIDGNIMKLYIDGILDNFKTKTDDIGSNTDFTIGYHPTAARYFEGIIDEVRIWNRALSGVEVAILNGSRGRI